MPIQGGLDTRWDRRIGPAAWADRREDSTVPRTVPDPPEPAGDLAVVSFLTRRAWERWLSANHTSSSGIWMQIAKKQGGARSVSYDEAVEVALSFGWIDGQKAPLDDQTWLQKFTPRRARSRWSRTNREKAEALIARGLMAPAGLAQVDLAKGDGRWAAAYDGQARAVIPDDLHAALKKNAKATAFFATLDSRNRYAILYRVQEARKPETRARRIAKFVEMLADGKKIHD